MSLWQLLGRVFPIPNGWVHCFTAYFVNTPKTWEPYFISRHEINQTISPSEMNSGLQQRARVWAADGATGMEPAAARPRGSAGNRAEKFLATTPPCPQRCRLHSSNPFPGRVHWWLQTQLNLGKPQLGCQASLYCPRTGIFLHKKFQSVFLSMFTDYTWRHLLLTLAPWRSFQILLKYHHQVNPYLVLIRNFW